MHLLIVEDDLTISAALSYSLEQEGFRITAAASVSEAMSRIRSDSYDLMLLDLTLPDGSGYDICRKVKENSDTPVIFLTACDDEVNIVMGLDMGADDYITKPFRVRELISRIHSVLRRCGHSGNNPDVYRIGPITVNPKDAKVYRNNSEIILTAMEYRLLLLLLKNKGQVLTRGQILEGIWDVSGDFVNDNTLTVYIKRLRQKLEEDISNPKIIETVRGLGYRIGDGNAEK